MPTAHPITTWHKYRILIIDDDQDMTQMLSEYLALDNFQVSVVQDAYQAEALLQQQQFDLLLLDLMLPYVNGLDFLRSFKSQYTQPVIMLSAHGHEADRVLGLEHGADDYLAKPFGPRELKARMQAVLRRSSDIKLSEPELLSFGPLQFHRDTGQILWHGESTKLTSTEERILTTLLHAPLKLVTREQISLYALGRTLSEHDRSLDTHISNIRRKLQLDQRNASISIRSVRGQGYILSFTGRQAS